MIIDITYKNILSNTSATSAFVKKNNLPDSFWESFHFRPTSKGITIVTTLSYAPMRGLDTTNAHLEEAVSKIIAKLNILQNANDNTGISELNAIGFKHRKIENRREEDIQASFINGMIAKRPEYLGIEFVASELTLEKKNRFDVVGIKDDCLYLFELKRKRTFYAAKQAASYVQLVNDNRDKFKEILCNYPQFNISNFSNVKGIVVMEYADRMTKKLISDARLIGIETWFFTENMMFKRF